LGPRVDVARKVATSAVSLDHLAAVFKRRTGAVEVPPPQQAREGTGRDELGDGASWEPVSGVERHDDRQAYRNDHLAESDDDDECVTLGSPTTSITSSASRLMP
jgi:hypothetical protein